MIIGPQMWNIVIISNIIVFAAGFLSKLKFNTAICSKKVN